LPNPLTLHLELFEQTVAFRRDCCIHVKLPDFLTLLFGPSRRRNTPPEDLTRLRRAWRWMQKTG
jgi:hypothetical protein